MAIHNDLESVMKGKDWFVVFRETIPLHLRPLYAALVLMARSRRDLVRLHNDVVKEDHRLNKGDLKALEQVGVLSHKSAVAKGGARQDDDVVRIMLTQLEPPAQAVLDYHRRMLEVRHWSSIASVWRKLRRVLSYEPESRFADVFLEVRIEEIADCNFIVALYIANDELTVVAQMVTRIVSAMQAKQLMEKMGQFEPSPHNCRSFGDADFWIELPIGPMKDLYQRHTDRPVYRECRVTAQNSAEFAQHPFFAEFCSAFTAKTGLHMTYVREGKREGLY